MRAPGRRAARSGLAGWLGLLRGAPDAFWLSSLSLQSGTRTLFAEGHPGHVVRPPGEEDLVLVGRNPPRNSLGECQGDCDSDRECRDGLVCYHRSGTEPVPGCAGRGVRGSDYCVDPPSGDPDSCFTIRTYNSIDRDVGALKNSIRDPRDRSHFLGGIVRLVAHDFMDYDRRPSDGLGRMGPDGCFDPGHGSNVGLPDIWCAGCPLTELYEDRYPHLSRADFWVAAGNAVIRQTSVGRALDMRGTFRWGREDAESCEGSGERLPIPTGCDEVEEVFLRNMGLSWRDAVALLGAHTLGRGDRTRSGHHGTWVDNDEDAQVFDKQYYEEMFRNSWRPRNHGRENQDWTTGRRPGGARVFLNVDVCLAFDVDGVAASKCCTRTGRRYPDGRDRCVDRQAARRRCPFLSGDHPRREAADAAREMLGGSLSSDDNRPFYDAFEEAWSKATTLGRTNLSPLVESCDAVW